MTADARSGSGTHFVIGRSPVRSCQMEHVEAAQHRLAMRPSRRGIPRTRRRLAGHCIRASRSSSRGSSLWRGGRRQIIATTPLPRPARPVDELTPAAEVAGLYRGRSVPPDLDRPHEPEPAKQIHAVGTRRARRAATRLKVPQEGRDRYDDDTVGVNSLISGSVCQECRVKR